MNTKTLRKVDLYIGVPLCFLLTLVHFGKNKVIKKKELQNPKKILFIKLWGMGSIVMIIPVLERAKKEYPDAKIYFLTFKSCEQATNLAKAYIDEVISIRNDNIFNFLFDTTKAYFYLLKERIDVVLDLEFFARFTALFNFLILPKYRVGFYNDHIEGLYRGNFLTHKVFYNHYVHTAVNFMNLFEALKCDPSDKPQVKKSTLLKDIKLKKYLSKKQDIVKLKEKLKSINSTFGDDSKLYILNNNTSDLGKELRRWPNEYFSELANKILASDTSNFVVFTGTKAEKKSVEEITNSVVPKDRIIDLVGATSVSELLDLFNLAKTFVTVDTGALHFASMTDIRIVALFSTETPILFGPMSENAVVLYRGLSCQPCLTVYNGKTPSCNNNRCLKEIMPEEVFTLINN